MQAPAVHICTTLSWRSVLAAMLILLLAPSSPARTSEREAFPGAAASLGGDLVAYYPFDGDANDTSGGGQNGIAYGGLAYGAGVAGSAATFDGFDDYVELPRVVENEFTIAFWVRTNSIAPNGVNWFEGHGLVDAEVCGSPVGGDWGIALINGGHVAWAASIHLESTVEVNDGDWHAVVATRDPVLGNASLWIDGVEEANGVFTSTAALTGPPWIGVGNNPCDVSFNRRWFAGSIDELRFFDRVLTPLEIGALSDDSVFYDGFESGDPSRWSAFSP